ncbi:MAG: hypothetical protein QME12_00850 [Nanoarchaeota archaeon]|nr:hypothetical protein [Nanoarchaeota archaeon]
MLRVIFDTTIYGFIAKENKEDRDKLISSLKSDRGFIIYGFSEIRREIKRVNKWISWGAISTILSLYQTLIASEYQNDPRIECLAKEYFCEYSKLGGKKQWADLRVDLMIVACASIKGMDIIYSGDRETMCSYSRWCWPFIKSYEKVNLQRGLRTPYFLKYKMLKMKVGIYKKIRL